MTLQRFYSLFGFATFWTLVVFGGYLAMKGTFITFGIAYGF